MYHALPLVNLQDVRYSCINLIFMCRYLSCETFWRKFTCWTRPSGSRWTSASPTPSYRIASRCSSQEYHGMPIFLSWSVFIMLQVLVIPHRFCLCIRTSTYLYVFLCVSPLCSLTVARYILRLMWPLFFREGAPVPGTMTEVWKSTDNHFCKYCKERDFFLIKEYLPGPP